MFWPCCVNVETRASTAAVAWEFDSDDVMSLAKELGSWEVKDEDCRWLVNAELVRVLPLKVDRLDSWLEYCARFPEPIYRKNSQMFNTLSIINKIHTFFIQYYSPLLGMFQLVRPQKFYSWFLRHHLLKSLQCLKVYGWTDRWMPEKSDGKANLTFQLRWAKYNYLEIKRMIHLRQWSF